MFRKAGCLNVRGYFSLNIVRVKGNAQRPQARSVSRSWTAKRSGGVPPILNEILRFSENGHNRSFLTRLSSVTYLKAIQFRLEQAPVCARACLSMLQLKMQSCFQDCPERGGEDKKTTSGEIATTYLSYQWTYVTFFSLFSAARFFHSFLSVGTDWLSADVRVCAGEVYTSMWKKNLLLGDNSRYNELLL